MSILSFLGVLLSLTPHAYSVSGYG